MEGICDNLMSVLTLDLNGSFAIRYGLQESFTQQPSHMDDIRRIAYFEVALQTPVGENSKLMQLWVSTERRPTESALQVPFSD